MRKCITCGQWIGHVHCLVGRPTECSICANVGRKLNTKENCQPTTLTHHTTPLTHNTLTQSTALCATSAGRGSHGNILAVDNGCPLSPGCQATYIPRDCLSASGSTTACVTTTPQAVGTKTTTHNREETRANVRGSLYLTSYKRSKRSRCRSSTGARRRRNKSPHLTVSFSREIVYPRSRHKLKFPSPYLVVHRLNVKDIESINKRYKNSDYDGLVHMESDMVPDSLSKTTPEQGSVTIIETGSSPAKETLTSTTETDITCQGESAKVKEEGNEIKDQGASAKVKEESNKVNDHGESAKVKDQEFWVITKPSSYREFAFCFAKLSNVR